MATAKQIAWRKKFAAMYGRKKKNKAKSTPSRSSKNRGMKMARRRRSYPKRVVARTRRSYRKFRGNRRGVVPVVDFLHGMYTLDGMTDNRINQAAQNYLGAVTGASSMSFENGNAHLQKGAEFALKNPSKSLQGGFTNFAKFYIARKVLGFVGIPKTVPFLGKKIQIR